MRIILRPLTLAVAAGFAIAGTASADQKQDYATTCYASYVTGRDNPGMQQNVAMEWENLQNADFAARVQLVEPHIGGVASFIYAESFADVMSGNMMAELLRRMRPAVLNAAVAKAAHCDTVFGAEPAIIPVSDQAVDMVRRQAESRDKAPEEIVTCSLVYKAGGENWEIRKSPLNAVWDGLETFDFNLRTFELDLYADTASAFGNVPAYVSFPPDEENWSKKLTTAMEAGDTDTQTAFFKEVAACDASFDMRNPLTEGPLVNPKVSHKECAVRYNSLTPFYAQSPQMQGYFQQRMVHAGRFIKLLGSEKSDQAILQDIGAATDTKVKTYLTPEGAADPRKLMVAFDEVAACDRQYAISVTVPPQELHRAARMAE